MKHKYNCNEHTPHRLSSTNNPNKAAYGTNGHVSDTRTKSLFQFFRSGHFLKTQGTSITRMHRNTVQFTHLGTNNNKKSRGVVPPNSYSGLSNSWESYISNFQFTYNIQDLLHFFSTIPRMWILINCHDKIHDGTMQLRYTHTLLILFSPTCQYGVLNAS